MSQIFLDSEKVDGGPIREITEKLSELLNSNELMGGDFKVFDIQVTDNTRVIKIPHGFKFTPTDFWISWINPTSTIVLRYDLVDETYIAFTSTDICRLRVIAGRIK